MLVAQKIEGIVNGVSEAPAELRHPSQGVLQVNALDSSTRGKMKRPPTVHVAQLTTNPAGYGSAFVHPIHRDQAEAYNVVVANEAVKVFDARTGAEYPVHASTAALEYLKGTEGFRALTIGDTTVLVNRGRRVRHASEASPAGKKEALFYVRQADFSTGYTLKLDGEEVTHVTVDGTSAQARQKISTDAIAAELVRLLRAHPRLQLQFSFELYGSTAYVTRRDGKDFTIEARDGLADKGLRVVKGAVQTFDELPYKAKDGYTVEIAGDEGSAKDNWWVVYDAADTPGQAGVWRETVRPGTLTALDPSTMPHKLVRAGFLMRELKAATPRAAIVSSGSYRTQQMGFTQPIQPPATPVFETTDDLVRDHGDGRRRPLALTEPGRPAKVFVNYDIDTSVMEPGTQAAVHLLRKKAGSSTFEPVATNHYSAGRTYEAQAFKVEDTFQAGEELEVRMDYGTGETPGAAYRRALMVLYRKNHPTYSGISVNIMESREIDFTGGRSKEYPWGFGGLRILTLKGLDATFPAGMGVQVSMNAATVTYTVGAADETAEQVAAGVAAVVNAYGNGFRATVEEPGKVLVYGPQDIAPTLSVAYDFDATRTAWVPGAGLVPGSLVGSKLLNLTDGSEGTIVANTASTLTVAALNGGTADRVEPEHRIAVKGSDATPYFTFEPCEWKRRTCGDLETAPWPSFVGQKIREVFFVQGRLGFTWGETAVLSGAGDLFRFFRETATDLLASDYIDAENGHPLTSDFHTAIPWNGELYLLSEAGQYVLSGSPVLTPQTVRLDLVSTFPTSSAARPFASGGRLFLTRGQGARAQVLEYTHPPQEAPRADDVTAACPGYIRGAPYLLVGDAALGFLAVVTAAERNVLYVYVHAYAADSTQIQASWSRWELPPKSEIVHAGVLDGLLTLIVKHNYGVSLETINLSEAFAPSGAAPAVNLDRRVQVEAKRDTVSHYWAWFLPYSIATDGSEGTVVVVRNDTGQVVPGTFRPSSTPNAVVSYEVDAGLPVPPPACTIGVRYGFRYVPNRIFLRHEDGTAETRGRLQLRYLDLQFRDTTSLSLTVSPQGRTPYTYKHQSATPAAGKLHVPVQARNELVEIEVHDSTPGALCVTGFDWEGFYAARAKRA